MAEILTISQGPTIGDVDGDGHTDVVVPTISGNIYVLSSKDGSFVRPYPYRTHGRVMNQVLLVDLNKRNEKKRGLTLVTTSFDGYLYLIDGPTCADVVDIGEISYVIYPPFVGTLFMFLVLKIRLMWVCNECTDIAWSWQTMWMVEMILILLLPP